MDLGYSQNSIRNWAIKLTLALYDAFAVNTSFFLALVVRFYINGKFSELGVPYISAFFSFAPYYTVCALIIFALFNMYNMIWRVAGINDLKRILLANVCTFLVQYIGSHVFVRRMPTSYYIIGAIIQLVLVCLIRFIPRILFYEGFQEKKKDAVPAMILRVVLIVLLILILLFIISFGVAYRHTEPTYPAMYRAGFWEYGKAPSIYEWLIKRLMDVSISFVALVVLSPVLLIIMLLIYIDDPGRVFFTQERVGLGKRTFRSTSSVR